MVELLTRNCIQPIYFAQSEGREDLQTPTVQILNVKKFPNSEGTADKYRLLISDGTYYMNGMVSVNACPQIASGEIGKDAVIRLLAWTLSSVNTRKILILLNVELVDKSVQGKLGDPANIETIDPNIERKKDATASRPAVPTSATLPSSGPVPSNSAPANAGSFYQSNVQAAASKPAASANVYNQPSLLNKPHQQNTSNSYAAKPPSAQQPSSDGAFANSVVPIKVLNPYTNKYFYLNHTRTQNVKSRWTIKVRVCNKSDLRKFNSQKGEGELFNVTFIDQSGEIKAAAFNEVARRLFPIFDENKVYYVTGGAIKPARKQYSSVQNEYEISMNEKTEVTPCSDTSSVPTVRYNFVPIERLFDYAKDSIIDIIGILKEIGDVVSIVAKSTQRQLMKRDLIFVDQTNSSVNVTLWGKLAENLDVTVNSVLAIKGVKVSDYNGRSLSTSPSSTITINPDIPEAYHLRGWYDSQGGDVSIQAMSTQQSSKRAGGVSSERKFLADIQNENMGLNEKPDYITVRAVTGLLKSDKNMWYNACPGEGCQKKVTQEGSEWRCEKCMRNYSYCEYRYIMNINIIDATGSAWVQCFNDSAELLLGHSAAELNQLKESDNQDALQSILNDAAHKSYIFKLRVKQEMYNEENRVKSAIVTIEPLNFVEECQYLANFIEQY